MTARFIMGFSLFKDARSNSRPEPMFWPGAVSHLTADTPRRRLAYRASSVSLARLPGFAERPERNPEQGQVLDEELPRDRRKCREAAETWLPDAGRGDQ